MNKIFFPTAYTSHSKVAFRYAQKLAQYFEASITLVHVYESPSSSLVTNAGLMEENLKQFGEQQRTSHLQKLKAFATEMNAKQFHDIELTFIVTDGDVAHELLNIQKEHRFDVIVMGMRKHKLRDRIFGNTTYRIIDEAICPLLLVPPDVHFMKVNRMLYGTAFEIGDDKTVDILLDWCLAFDATLNILHVHKKANADQAALKMDQLSKGFENERSEKIISFQLREGNIVETLSQHVASTDVDLIAIHRRKQGFLQRVIDGSLTKLLSEDLTVPLLVLKSQATAL